MDATVTTDNLDAALIGEGAALDNAAAPPPLDEAGQPIAPTNYADEAATLVTLICDSAQAIFADSGLEISAPTRTKLAAAWSPVLEKYGVTGAGLFGEYSAEVGAAIVTVPVILAAVKVVKRGKPAAAAPADTGIVEPLPFA